MFSIMSKWFYTACAGGVGGLAGAVIFGLPVGVLLMGSLKEDVTLPVAIWSAGLGGYLMGRIAKEGDLKKSADENAKRRLEAQYGKSSASKFFE